MAEKEQPRKGKGGRPRKPPKDVRTYAINVRWSEEEALTLEKWREASGYPQLATYIRTAILKQGPPPATVPKMNLAKWGELARLGANINQLADHANKGHILGPSDQRALINLMIETRQELRRLRYLLLGVEQVKE